MASQDGAVRFSVLTFNIRAIMDRWRERRGLLQAVIKEADADVVALQECLTGEYGQDRMLLGPEYRLHPCRAAVENLLREGPLAATFARVCLRAASFWPTRAVLVLLPEVVEALREALRWDADWLRQLRDLTLAPFFGNSLATRLAGVRELRHEALVLGGFRAAHRLAVAVRDEAHQAEYRVWLVNTHLDHDLPGTRAAQAEAVCQWMDAQKPGSAAIVLCGDLNGGPQEDFHRLLAVRGYQSAHLEAHGHEPHVTWPSGIVAPLAEAGPPDCLDYIYVWAAPGFECRALAAALVGDQPAQHDKTLYASDHAGLRATLELRPTG